MMPHFEGHNRMSLFKEMIKKHNLMWLIFAVLMYIDEHFSWLYITVALFVC